MRKFKMTDGFKLEKINSAIFDETEIFVYGLFSK